MTNLPPRSIDQLDDTVTRPSDRVLQAIELCAGDFAVLGAGGKMGFHVTRMLQRSLQQLGRNSRITAVSRFAAAESRQPFERHGVNILAADLSDARQVASIPDFDNVIYLAGIKFGTSTDADLLTRMNATMPRLVAGRFCDARIVALSTGCVYSFTTPQSGGSTEQDETDPPGQYAQSCLQRERAFIDGSQQHGTLCALVRLNYSIDLRYGVLVDIAQHVRAGLPIDVETGFVNVIWQGDAVAGILQCLPQAALPPWIVNVTGAETLRVRDIAGKFAERFGREPFFVGEEAPTCWLSNSSRARELFGEPAVDVDCMIDWIADWLDRGGPTLDKPTHFQNRDGNY